jgi:VWFA-related protein
MNPLHKSPAVAAPRPVCAVLLLVSFALTAAAQSAQPPGVMTLDVTVTDGEGRYVGGLTKEQFALTDGGTPREIKNLSFGGEPASVGVLFDISASMRSGRRNKVEDTRRAFARFVSSASPQNEYFLWAFNKTVTRLTGWVRGEAELSQGLGKIAPAAMPTKGSGGTAVYDALTAALEEVAGGSRRKRVLLIFTDGGSDNGASRALFKTLKCKVRESEALIYSVATVERESPGALDPTGQAELDELGAASGGRAYFPEVAELNGIVDRIAFELDKQYAISFEPANAAKKGELNRLKIKLKPPPTFKGTLHVRAREGYVSAPG